MRVFVLGTGRCGSVTFYRACRHITNYTSTHESVFRKPNKLDWPDDHIAVEPSLWPLAALLREEFANAIFVHLIRTDRAAFCDSYRTLGAGPVYSAMADHPVPVIDIWSSCHVGFPQNEADRRHALGLFYDTVNAVIESVEPEIRVRLEHAKSDWPKFWRHIGAQGDARASLKTWNHKHNSRRGRAHAC